MKIKILTIFPELVKVPLQESMLGKAAQKGLMEFEIIDIRDFSIDKHATVDDTPYGGGGGMVMKPEPLALALEKALSFSENPRIILTSAGGTRFDQNLAQMLSQEKCLILVCGHYAGVDERIKELFPMEEISLGDFVLTGGELPALVMIDAVVRLIPGVLGNFDSAQNDSFQNGLLGYPLYTKPQVFRGRGVPEVLLSGNHQEIAAWRKKKALETTYRHRPDLLVDLNLSKEDSEFIQQLRTASQRKE